MLLFLGNFEYGELLFTLGYLLVVFFVSVALPCWLIIELIRWLRRH